MEMLQLDFIQRTLAGLASCITPIIGLLLILKRQSMMADTLSHISLAGYFGDDSIVSLTVTTY